VLASTVKRKGQNKVELYWLSAQSMPMSFQPKMLASTITFIKRPATSKFWLVPLRQKWSNHMI
jgi:hypothetical protein